MCDNCKVEVKNEVNDYILVVYNTEFDHTDYYAFSSFDKLGEFVLNLNYKKYCICDSIVVDGYDFIEPWD